MLISFSKTIFMVKKHESADVAKDYETFLF